MSAAFPTYVIDGTNVESSWLRIDEGGQQVGIAKGSKEKLGKSKQLHEELVKRYSKSEGVKALAASARALSDLENGLYDDLRTCLIKRGYTKGKCAFCPV